MKTPTIEYRKPKPALPGLGSAVEAERLRRSTSALLGEPVEAHWTLDTGETLPVLRLCFKVLKSNGSPSHGGKEEFRYSLPHQNDRGEWIPGAWTKRKYLRPVLCRQGYHVIRNNTVWLPSWIAAAQSSYFSGVETTVYLAQSAGKRASDPQATGSGDGKESWGLLRLLRPALTEHDMLSYCADCAEEVVTVWESRDHRPWGNAMKDDPAQDSARLMLSWFRDYLAGKLGRETEGKEVLKGRVRSLINDTTNSVGWSDADLRNVLAQLLRYYRADRLMGDWLQNAAWALARHREGRGYELEDFHMERIYQLDLLKWYLEGQGTEPVILLSEGEGGAEP